jgi:DMSO/TMAO reductase YedYZ heme-binding membrane subunit
VKSDYNEPIFYASIMFIVLIMRLFGWVKKKIKLRKQEKFSVVMD